MASVKLSKVDKFFGDTKALSQVSLEIEDGQFTVFVGPSGCGKSTLLRAIAGLEGINGGEIHIDGKNVTQVAPSDRDLAMVFQTYALYPHMTVHANMEFGMKVNGTPPAQRRERVLEAAKILQLEEFLNRKPGQLSGGQRQRVAIGRAIVKQPKLFLFDEPLSNLDAKLRVKMRVELESLHKQLGVTMIYVTHDQVEAMTMADKIVVLNDGMIEQIGTPLSLYHRPQTEFVAGFIGSPSMNILDVQCRDQSVMLGATELTRFAGAADITRIGIRPEHLTIKAAQNSNLPVLIKVKETLGGEAFLYTKHLESNAEIVIKTDGDDPHQAGETIGLEFPEKRIHLFSADGMAVSQTNEIG